MAIFKIYGLFDPWGRLRYVGVTIKTLGQRLSGHVREAKRGAMHRRAKWIRSILEVDQPQILLLAETQDEIEAYALEAAHIQFAKEEGHDLVNGTPGGIGTGSGESSWHYGKTRNPETGRKISAAKKGKPFSLEHCEKLKLAHQGVALSEEHCKNLSLERRSRGPKKGNRSGYKGVAAHGPSWRARLGHTILGNFATAEEAARARDAVARRLWGNDCYLNFP